MNMFCPLAEDAFPTVSCLASGMVTKISCKSADVLKLKGERSSCLVSPNFFKCGPGWLHQGIALL